MRIKLIEPSKEHENMVMQYKQEFIVNGDELHGSGGLYDCNDYNEWLELLKCYKDVNLIPEDHVLSTEFLAVSLDDNRIIGMINIRHYLNKYLLDFGGHIGYSIRPCERRKGFGTEMLNLALGVCKELNIEKVLVTCDKENIGSAGVILNNCFVLENELDHNGKITQRYWKNL